MSLQATNSFTQSVVNSANQIKSSFSAERVSATWNNRKVQVILSGLALAAGVVTLAVGGASVAAIVSGTALAALGLGSAIHAYANTPESLKDRATQFLQSVESELSAAKSEIIDELPDFKSVEPTIQSTIAQENAVASEIASELAAEKREVEAEAQQIEQEREQQISEAQESEFSGFSEEIALPSPAASSSSWIKTGLKLTAGAALAFGIGALLHRSGLFETDNRPVFGPPNEPTTSTWQDAPSPFTTPSMGMSTWQDAPSSLIIPSVGTSTGQNASLPLIEPNITRTWVTSDALSNPQIEQPSLMGPPTCDASSIGVTLTDAASRLKNRALKAFDFQWPVRNQFMIRATNTTYQNTSYSIDNPKFKVCPMPLGTIIFNKLSPVANGIQQASSYAYQKGGEAFEAINDFGYALMTEPLATLEKSNEAISKVTTPIFEGVYKGLADGLKWVGQQKQFV